MELQVVLLCYKWPKKRLLQARVGSYSRKRKRSSFWSKSYNNMLVSVMFLSQECNLNQCKSESSIEVLLSFLQAPHFKIKSSPAWGLRLRPTNVSCQQRHLGLFTDHNALVKLVFLYFH